MTRLHHRTLTIEGLAAEASLDRCRPVLRRLAGRGVAQIQAAVREITGETEIDPSTPLRRYGLDSLMSMRLLAVLNERYGLALQLADLAQHQTVGELAGLVQGPRPDPIDPNDWLLERLAIR